MTTEERIRSRARELGFDLVGIAPPGSLRPPVRSIVSVAMNYHAGGPALPCGGDLRGRIARFARGDDYHLVVGARLRKLCGFLVECGARVARPYVDAGPLFERAIAQQAGLGWRGRNSCLITGGFGSWVVLGEITTDLALRPDASASGDCGSCEACMRGEAACPTGAIFAPGIVDAHRCIAYWTIEHRGWIPLDVRPMLQDMIFGCDICQEVCPRNRAPESVAAHPEFAPRPEIGAHPRLLPLLGIGEDEFRRLFRRSGIKRAGRRGLRRNVAVALGNAGDARAVPDLALALRDPEDPVVRGHAAWALGRIGGSCALDALRAARACEEDPRVREEIFAALEASSAAGQQR